VIRVVLDTNVLLSGVISQASVPGQILLAWHASRFQLILSTPILTELARALETPYFRRRLGHEDRIALLRALAELAVMVEIVGDVPRQATHPEDDLILATAQAAQAQYLVTGDKHLQALGAYQGSTIVSPRAFLDLLADMD